MRHFTADDRRAGRSGSPDGQHRRAARRSAVSQPLAQRDPALNRRDPLLAPARLATPRAFHHARRSERLASAEHHAPRRPRLARRQDRLPSRPDALFLAAVSKPTPVFYIFHGDNQFELRAALRDLRARMAEADATGDLNISQFDGATASVAQVISTAQMVPFLADRRLVIVHGMLTHLAPKPRRGKGRSEDSAPEAPQSTTALEALLAALPTLPETARLVFAEPTTLRETHPILKFAKREDSRGLVKLFAIKHDPKSHPDHPKWDSAWLSAWIAKRVEHYGASIERRAITTLAQLVGQDLYALDNECAKLAAYVGASRPITEKDIATLTSYVPEANIFDIVEALAKGDAKTALSLMHRSIERFGESPLGILAMINRQFRLLIQVREALDDPRCEAELRQTEDFKNLSEFALNKLRAQARRFPLPELERIYLRLLEIDHSIKVGKMTDVLALDLLASGLASQA
ncbi:MAG: DNA polymerase III subunit delta [Candidatus Thermofonsia Clade 1 bacterium]|uniref:DNA polymerase III subunit delta n=1 Tax=Candidatus Thermofonsia Clade 1 bacterium TaxID=2364210 RepID=A0A2M8PID6_9CHLR|nr:MAG: DNA polymerase III subunit delta [Candidatus Thermofonsia Clade 1 bacterium]